MSRQHALLSASSAHRWINCPPSAKLQELYEDKGSAYADQGTDAHSLAEWKLRNALGMDAGPDPRPGLQYYDDEMEEHTDDYAAFMQLVDDFLQRLVVLPFLVGDGLDLWFLYFHSSAPFRQA